MEQNAPPRLVDCMVKKLMVCFGRDVREKNKHTPNRNVRGCRKGAETKSRL